MSRDPFSLVGLVVDGKYRVEGLLGEGGNGVVYAATQIALRQPVALKCLKLGGGADPAEIARFTREARVLFGLSHPAIVRMYDVGEVMTPSGSVPYVVLERIAGRGLDELVRARGLGQAPPFSPAELLAIFEPILDALAFAHARGVVHRDMKPSNVMVLGEGAAATAKLLDFGTARAGGAGLATTGAGGLTPRYAAPEQWNATYGGVGPTTDLFAVGLMLEEACTLTFALAGDTLSELVASATSPSRRNRVPELRPDLAPLAEVVARATAVSPAQRYPSGQVMAAALRAALGAPPRTSIPSPSAPPAEGTLQSAVGVSLGPPPGTLPPAGMLRTSAAPPPLAPTTPDPTLRPARSSSGGLILALALGVPLVLLLVAGAAGAGWYMHSARTSEVPTVTSATAPPVPPPPSAVASASARATASAPPPPPPPAPSAPPSLAVVPTTRPSAPAGPTAPVGPATAPTATASADRKLVYGHAVGSYANLYPKAGEFTKVVESNGGRLQRCLANEHVTDSWSMIVRVTFYPGAGRGVAMQIIHEGGTVPAGDPTGERIKDCALNEVAMWPWPAAPPGEPDGGKPTLSFSAGLYWQRAR